MDIINCIANCFTALGTVGATIVSLVLAYGGSHKRISVKLGVYFSGIPTKALKTIEITLYNPSNYNIAVDNIDLEFQCSTKQRSYNNIFSLSTEPLLYIGDDEKTHPVKYPLRITPRETKCLRLVCDDGSSEVGASIAKYLDKALKAHLEVVVKDRSGRVSHDKKRHIQPFKS